MRALLSALALLLVFGSSVANGSEKALAAVPLPDNVELEPIAINLLQNGHLLSIARITPQSSVEEALSFYRQQWQEPLAEGFPGYVENTAEDWSIISRPQDGWNQVVQFRTTPEGIEGRLSVLQLQASSSPVPVIAMPSNAVLMSSTGGHDIGHDSSTYVVFSQSDISTVSDFYRHHFEGEGWSRVSDKKIMKSQVMLMQREGERAELVVSRVPTGGTLVVINKVLDHG